MSEPDIPRFLFAPSPTGSPHVGSLRSALFSWALARGMGGDLLLRIDDTDPARSTSQAADEMIAALQWLGIDWDEGPRVGGPHAPYFQSQRGRRYEAVAAELVQRQAAYYGDDPAADLGAQAGAPLRLRLPREGETIVEDALRGAVTFDNTSLQDPVIVRSDGSPRNHLAGVVDDHDMAVSHVVRGEEWLSSTPIHIHLYRALEWVPPVWIHLPPIHNESGEKLSERDRQGGYLVGDFEDAGYLPEALFNYLLLLGWSPEGSQEIVSKWDVRQQFRLERLSASPATFDWEKLNWVNRQYLKRKSDARLAALIRPYLEDVYDLSGTGEQWPVKADRNARLEECGDVMRRLWSGEEVTHDGHVTVEQATLYTRPDSPPPLIGAALSAETAGWLWSLNGSSNANSTTSRFTTSTDS
jgi:glutamyl-tRNA synthetase